MISQNVNNRNILYCYCNDAFTPVQIPYTNYYITKIKMFGKKGNESNIVHANKIIK